jgi:hypothetical protein
MHVAQEKIMSVHSTTKATRYSLVPPSQIISHSKILGESKYLKFDQCYSKNYKDL